MESSGKPSTKELLARELREAISSARSPEELKSVLASMNIECYERGGQPTGVWFGNRKFRFRTLVPDYDPNQLQVKQTEKEEQGRDQVDVKDQPEIENPGIADLPEIEPQLDSEPDVPVEDPAQSSIEFNERMESLSSLRREEEERERGDLELLE